MVRNPGFRWMSFAVGGLIPLFLLFSLPVLGGSAVQAGDCPPCPPCEGEQKAGVYEGDVEEQEAPEEIELNRLSDVYEAVSFSHAEHADYADEGCVQCHHHQTSGEFKACNACHKRALFQDVDKLNMPGLNGAYHRQCVGCHVENGSDVTGCTDCHELKEEASAKK